MKGEPRPLMQYQDDDLIVLFYLQKYGFLTIEQATKSINTNRKPSTISRRLRMMADAGLVGWFGNQKLGFERVPKVYYIKESGYALLEENRIPAEMLGRFKKRNKCTWSPVFRHRVDTVDLFLSLEIALRERPELELVKTFMDYNKDDSGASETADFAGEPVKENKIIPDGAFIIKSHETGQKALFFLEMDKGTESITSRIAPNDRAHTLHAKITKYDNYLMSQNYDSKYAEWGSFTGFLLLFVTNRPRRIDNIRAAVSDLPDELHQFYFFGELEAVKENFFNDQWKGRNIKDNEGKRVI